MTGHFVARSSRNYALGAQNCQTIALALAVLICDGDGFETWDSLEHLSLFTKSSLIPPLLFLKDYHKLQWIDPKLWKRATRVASRPLESSQPARLKEEEESRKVQKLNGLIGMAYTVSGIFRDNKDVGRHEDEASKRKRMMTESWNLFAEMLTFMEHIPKGKYDWVRSL